MLGNLFTSRLFPDVFVCPLDSGEMAKNTKEFIFLGVLYDRSKDRVQILKLVQESSRE